MKINFVIIERVHGGWVCKVIALVHISGQDRAVPVAFKRAGVFWATALVVGYLSAWWQARKMESFHRWLQKDHGWQ